MLIKNPSTCQCSDDNCYRDLLKTIINKQSMALILYMTVHLMKMLQFIDERYKCDYLKNQSNHPCTFYWRSGSCQSKITFTKE